MSGAVAFEESDVPPSASLLTRRHARHRTWSPFLVDRFDAELHIRREVENGSGAAVRDLAVRGYLVGQRREDAIGEYLYSGVAGHATDEPKLIEVLYTTAAERWVDEGLRRHFVFVPASRAFIEPWQQLGFALSGVLGARGITNPGEREPPRWVRLANTGDATPLAGLELELEGHLRTSPSFNDLPSHEHSEVVREWQEALVDRRFTCFVADRDGVIDGYLLLFRRPHDNQRIPWLSIDLASAVTSLESRRQGVAAALTNAALAWAWSRGYRTMTIDWRTTNRIAAHVWPSLGFQEVFTRLYRSIP